MTNRELKKKPAGKHDVVKIAYANFATDRKKTELKIEGKEFDNEELLRTLGFEERDGAMTLRTSDNEVEKDANGEVVKRTQNGKVLTDKTEERDR
jgi:hypothetical protein